MSEDYKQAYKKMIEEVKKKKTRKDGGKFRNEDIAKDLGYNRSYFSQLLGDKGEVTEDHLKMLKLHYPDVLEIITSPTTNNTMDTKDELIAMQRKQIELHEKYAAVLEHRQINLDVIHETLRVQGAHIHALYDRMPKHLSQTESISEQQAADELDNYLKKYLTQTAEQHHV